LCGHRSKRLASASAPLSHRIEGAVVESATGDYAPNIEATYEARRTRAQAITGVLPSTEPPTRAKNRQKMMEVRHFLRSEGILGAAHPAAGAPRPGTVICLNRISPPAATESISRDLDAMRAANTAKLPRRDQF